MKRHFVPILFLLFFIISCREEKQVDTAAEEEKIKALFVNWAKDLSEQGNADAYFRYTTEDITFMEAGSGFINNRNEIKASIDSFFKYNSFSVIDFNSQEIIIRDDIGIHRYLATVVWKSKTDTASTALKLKYLDVLKKGNDGKWKVYIHSNSPVQ